MSIRGSRERKLAAIAELQRGRASRRQLLAAGITSSMIKTMLGNGRLLRRYPGVYAVGHAAPVEFARETEVLLACPDGALLSHVSAGALWGIVPHPGRYAAVDITIAGTQTPRHQGIRAHRTSNLDARKEVRIHRGLPVTSPARTFVDIAGQRSEYELERALDDALHRHLVRLPQLRDAMTRAGHTRKGTRLLDAILTDREHGSGFSRSDAEIKLRNLIRHAQLPAPELNEKLSRYEPDMLWREQRLIVEIDSWDWHGSRRSFENDRQRDATLTAQGWTILRFTARQIRDEPYVVLAHLAAALALARQPAQLRR